MADAQPKCVRLMVTAVYADGTIAQVDVPEPADCTLELKRLPSPLPLDVFTMRLLPESGEFIIRAKLGHRGAQALARPAAGDAHHGAA